MNVSLEELYILKIRKFQIKLLLKKISPRFLFHYLKLMIKTLPRLFQLFLDLNTLKLQKQSKMLYKELLLSLKYLRLYYLCN